MRVMMMLAAAAALVPGAAVAQPLAANAIPVDPNRSVAGHFDAPGTQTWRVYLHQGRTYAVWGSHAQSLGVAVRAAGGKVLAAFRMSDEVEPNGAGFRAPYTGLYAVDVTCAPADAADCVGAGYTLTAARDCPGDTSTSCGITPGGTLHGLVLGFFEDVDYFHARLRAGAYVVSVAIPTPNECQFGVDVSVLDAQGRRLAGASLDCATTALPFTAARDGTYYLAVSSGDNPISTYDLALSRH